MPGNLGRIFDHMMSAAHWHTTIGWSVIITSTGASADVCTSLPPEPRWIDTTVSVSVTARPERVPGVGVEARVVEQCGVLGERQRMAALGRGAPHLGGGELGVPQHRQRHRDEPVGVRAAPLVDVPVVVGLHHCEGEVLVGRGREQPPGEARERREVERAEHAARVHVLHAFVDVPAPAAHLLVRHRLDAVLLTRSAGDRVEPHVGHRLAVEHPDVVADVGVHDLRGPVAVAIGDVGVEQRGRLDEVVVDAHQDQCIGVHAESSSGR